MPQADSSAVPLGTILEGKFRLTQEIGRGGMASVYEAENIDIGKRVDRVLGIVHRKSLFYSRASRHSSGAA